MKHEQACQECRGGPHETEVISLLKPEELIRSARGMCVPWYMKPLSPHQSAGHASTTHMPHQ